MSFAKIARFVGFRLLDVVAPGLGVLGDLLTAAEVVDTIATVSDCVEVASATRDVIEVLEPVADAADLVELGQSASKTAIARIAYRNSAIIRQCRDDSTRKALLDLYLLFWRYDANDDGKLTQRELLLLFHAMDDPRTEREIKAMLQDYDENGDGL